MIRPTGITQDLESVRAAVRPLDDELRAKGQVMITSRPGSSQPLSDDIGWLGDGVKEADFTRLNHEFKGTGIEELLKQLDLPYGRVRLMLMRPKSCLSIHVDGGLRYHYAVETAPDCFISEVNGATATLHHVPSDGRLYEMDAFRVHSAMNTGKCMRVHIVINAADARRPADAAPVGRLKGPATLPA